MLERGCNLPPFRRRPPATDHEEDAAGLTASVLHIRRQMPFVPGLFKALAHNPDALLAVWPRARALLDDPRTTQAAAELRTSSRPGLGLRLRLRS